MVFKAQKGDKVMLLCSSIVAEPALDDVLVEIRNSIGKEGVVTVADSGKDLSEYGTSAFDIIAWDITTVFTACHDSKAMVEIARILKPGGKFILREAATTTDTDVLRKPSSILGCLMLSGFISISEPQPIELTPDQLEKLKTESTIDDISVIEVTAFKPNFEVGSSLNLSYSKPAEIKSNEDVSNVWKLSASDALDENELIDSDLLLDEDDLKKPDLASLKVGCEGTKKRKACKNCTCGLAEELEAEAKPIITTTSNSACGSCYLGDAFRCASCPYLGMPAFKPGERVILTDGKMKSDI